ncbi:DUF447 domain-containing protein [Beduinella massiliensis]|uniref:DUF447 domain-containing protein n=1 Tax=Beduinella massiliensis TaxID=1852363 RepID=UPI000C856F02
MKRKSIGTNYSMCVQPTFIVGTYNEDGRPNFAPITWVSATCEGENYLIVVSIYGKKRTKQNILRTGQLSVNLVSVDMLELVDYFGNSSAEHRGDGNISYSYTASEYVYAPLLDSSRWIYECEVSEAIKTGESDTFFCRIKNVQIDESIDVGNTFEINLVPFEPVIYSGQYHSLGKHLGKIGDFYKR